ncbi:MlaD family protein [Mycobacterium sp. MBM]|nr:MlaD family protein [Mycobacterium sp. MBM]
MKPAGALWRLAITVVVAVMFFVLLQNAITRPVAPAARSYSAEFTDVSGLYVGADVRVRGVPAGKVQSVELERRRGQTVGRVGITLDDRFGLVNESRLAIKYQTLTGTRYVDVVNASESYQPADLVTDLPTTMTTPSFDVTALFNGLQPVLATLSPEQLNTFTSNAVTFLNGDGEGLGPLLQSIDTLTRFVSDRQMVVAALMQNFSTVAESMGGHSRDVIQILDWVNRPLDGVLSVLDEFRKTELYSVDFLDALKQILTNIGFPAQGNSSTSFVYQNPNVALDTNVSNINEGLDRAFAGLDSFIDSMKLVPVMWENIGPPSQPEAPLPCSRGHFQLPEQMDVLLNGQRVVLCNR